MEESQEKENEKCICGMPHPGLPHTLTWHSRGRQSRQRSIPLPSLEGFGKTFRPFSPAKRPCLRLLNQDQRSATWSSSKPTTVCTYFPDLGCEAPNSPPTLHLETKSWILQDLHDQDRFCSNAEKSKQQFKGFLMETKLRLTSLPHLRRKPDSSLDLDTGWLKTWMTCRSKTLTRSLKVKSGSAGQKIVKTSLDLHFS